MLQATRPNRHNSASQAARAIVMARLAEHARLREIKQAYAARLPASFTILAMALDRSLVCKVDWDEVCRMGRELTPLDPLFGAPAIRRQAFLTACAARH